MGDQVETLQFFWVTKICTEIQRAYTKVNIVTRHGASHHPSMDVERSPCFSLRTSRIKDRGETRSEGVDPPIPSPTGRPLGTSLSSGNPNSKKSENNLPLTRIFAFPQNTTSLHNDADLHSDPNTSPKQFAAMLLLPLTMLLMWGEQWIGLRAVLCASYATESLLVTTARSSRLRILYVEAHSKTWVSYYADTVRSLGKLHELQYLRLTEPSDHARRTRLARAIKDGGGHFDVLVLGWGYLREEANQWLPPEFMQSLQITLAIVLNKEYVDLERKLQYIHGCNVVAAFTAHHEVSKYTNVTQIQFHRIPFAAVPQKFDFASVPSPKLYRYDFGFTGIMRKEQTQNWREQILNDLKNFRDLGIRMFTQTGLKFRPLPSKKYRKILQQTRIWLSTTGPEDLVGTRYFVVLMSGTTMLICNCIAKVYDGLFEEDRHVVMFSSLEELRRKVKYYIDNEQERQKIVRQAHTLALANHSFDNRARELGCILKDSIDYRSRPKSRTLKGPIPWELVSQQDEFTMNGNFPLRSRALRRQDQPGSWSNGQ